MEIKVHRGLDQIGGCITEIFTASSRVFIDMGQNLPGCGTPQSDEDDCRMVHELFAQNHKTNEAVYYTHVHDDHVGLFMYVPDDVPQYMGAGSRQLLTIKYQNLKQQEPDEDYDALLNRIHGFRVWTDGIVPQPMHTGDITITPFPCSHSIYDSHMFLIEADGQRIWHTGDFRGHGFLSENLYPVLDRWATDIDTLIIEGTTLKAGDICMTEEEVSNRMKQQMDAYEHVFVLVSPTDAERLSAIVRAASLAHRMVKVTSPLLNDYMTLFGMTDNLQFISSDSESIADCDHSVCVMPVILSQLEEVRKRITTLDPATTLLIYSQWDAYYKDPAMKEQNPDYLEFRNLFSHVVDIHTSGHADRSTLARVIERVNPHYIIGIHKDADVSHRMLELPGQIAARILN